MNMQTPIRAAFAIDIFEKPDAAYRKEQRGSEKYKKLKAISHQRFDIQRVHPDNI